jgi:hypothetical protein
MDKKKKKGLFSWLFDDAWFLGHKCSHCGSRNTEHGYWSRGYNTYCEQAYGDNGHLCLKCYHVDFDVPLEEHKELMAKAAPWCIPSR